MGARWFDRDTQEKQTGGELVTPISRRVSTHSVRSVCSREERAEPLDVEPPVAPLAAEPPATVQSVFADAMQQGDPTVQDPQRADPSESTQPAPPAPEAPHADASADETPEDTIAVPLDPEQALFEEFRTMRHPQFVSPNKVAKVQPPLPPPPAAAPVVAMYTTQFPEATPTPPPPPAPSQPSQPAATAPAQPAIAPPPPRAPTPQQAVHPSASPFQPRLHAPTSWAQLPPPPPPPSASPLQYPPHYGAPYAQPPSARPSIERAVPMIAVANGAGVGGGGVGGGGVGGGGVGGGGEQPVPRTAGGELVELVDALTECLDNDRGWMKDIFHQLDTDEDRLLFDSQVLDLVQLVVPRVTDRQVRRKGARWREG